MKSGSISGDGRVASAIIVMGVGGSGKSTFAQALANHCGVDLIEGDLSHSAGNLAKMRAGIPLSDEDRWPWLDEIARNVIEYRSETGLAIGTCSALKRSYRQRLRRQIGPDTHFICLDVSEETLRGRLNTRADHFMPTSLLTSQLDALELPQDEPHVLVLDGAVTVEALVDEATSWLVECGPSTTERLRRTTLFFDQIAANVTTSTGRI